MHHRRGIDLVCVELLLAPTVPEEPSEHTYRVEVWSDPPEDGGELLETISRCTDHSVSCAAYQAAIRQRPGKVLIHRNGRHKMSAEVAPDPPLPLQRGRPSGGSGRVHAV